jgi:5'-nucleotidase (lipoprotein e(P4) family)
MHHAKSPLVLLPLALTLLAGCASAPPPHAAAAPPPSVTTSTTASALPADLPDDDRWVLSSSEYAAATWQAYVLAGRRAEELAAGRASGSWAVVLDVDETVLSNVQFEIDLARVHRDYDEPSWRRWENRGVATAIPGAARFCQRVQALGGKVVLVTNREEDQRAPTEANLRHENVPFDVLLLRPNGSPNDKRARWQAVQDGTAVPGIGPLAVVLFVGDNILDFPGLDQTLRSKGDAALAPFGDRFIVIPNPMYGSWKPARSPAAAAPAEGGGN